MRIRSLLMALALGTALPLLPSARDARACGGCFIAPSPTESGTVVTDHRMILAVSPQQTTLYDQIRYQGAPSSFAWVLPIRGPVAVGLSADVLFAALEQVTRTTVVAPPLPCPPPATCPACGGPYLKTNFTAVVDTPALPPVTVLGKAVVGPYDTVQLQSTDPVALETWLTANGYAVPESIRSTLAAYVADGFDFLALRLEPGQGVQAMRPVSVTSAGAGLTLPLRMVAAGTGATVGVTLWVVAQGRYEPQNFATFAVSPSELTWDWTAKDSDYATVRANKEAAFGHAAWQIESALEIPLARVEGFVLARPADTDYPSSPAPDAALDDAGPGVTAEEARRQDLATLFAADAATVVVTRMRADLSQAALANDLVLQASAEQAPMSNVYRVTRAVGVPACPKYAPLTCPPCGKGGGLGCATASQADGGGEAVVLAGLVGLLVVRAYGRRRRRPRL
jgi:MYXO-CTERM domain-containing protein